MKSEHKFPLILVSLLVIGFVIATAFVVFQDAFRLNTLQDTQGNVFKTINRRVLVAVDDVPSVVSDAVTEFVDTQPDYELTTNSDADITVNNVSTGELLHEVIFVPVVRFSSLQEAITLADLDGYAHNTTSQTSVYVLAPDEALATALFEKTPHLTVVKTVDDFLAKADEGILLLPFDALVPTVKVLTLDDVSILDKTVDNTDWPLAVRSYVSTLSDSTDLTALKALLPLTNRDTDQIKTIVMTGVTAISRGVEDAIAKNNDVLFPARGVMDELSKADITHVDSENPFFDDCIPPREGVILCGRTESIASLKAIGVDVVDLTGNHENDYGPEHALESMDHLTSAGFDLFGGGRNDKEAAAILYKKLGDMTVAFLGYNYWDVIAFGPDYHTLAQDNYPGSNAYSEEKMAQDIKTARKNADFVIVDFQFIEEYQTDPLASQVEVFRQAAELGADLVVGVQAHQPQKIEFYNNSLIFYGLGNLFFDQMWSYPTRQGLIPRFTFYDGHLASVEVLTTLLYDYAQPRFTTGSERTDLLKQILP